MFVHWWERFGREGDVCDSGKEMGEFLEHCR